MSTTCRLLSFIAVFELVSLYCVTLVSYFFCICPICINFFGFQWRALVQILPPTNKLRQISLTGSVQNAVLLLGLLQNLNTNIWGGLIHLAMTCQFMRMLMGCSGLSATIASNLIMLSVLRMSQLMYLKRKDLFVVKYISVLNLFHLVFSLSFFLLVSSGMGPKKKPTPRKPRPVVGRGRRQACGARGQPKPRKPGSSHSGTKLNQWCKKDFACAVAGK